MRLSIMQATMTALTIIPVMQDIPRQIRKLWMTFPGRESDYEGMKRLYPADR